MIDIPFSQFIVNQTGLIGALFILSLLGNLLLLRKNFKDNDKQYDLIKQVTESTTGFNKDLVNGNTNTISAINSNTNSLNSLATAVNNFIAAKSR